MKKLVMSMLVLCSIAFGGTFDDAIAAYNKQSYIEALNLFYVLAKEGDNKAQYNVALMYENGQGVKADINQARQWYEKAAKGGNAKAAYNLARLYQSLEGKVPHAIEMARYWYEKAVDGGISQAYNNLATLYLEGKGVPKDNKKALELLQKAVSEGNHKAEYNLGILYGWGDNIQRDKLKAYENLTKAIKGGVSQAGDYLDKLCKESAWVCKN
jgi:TPR repeat protein